MPLSASPEGAGVASSRATRDTVRSRWTPPRPTKAYSRRHGCRAKEMVCEETGEPDLASSGFWSYLHRRSRPSDSRLQGQSEVPVQPLGPFRARGEKPPPCHGSPLDGDIYWVRLAAVNGWPLFDSHHPSRRRRSKRVGAASPCAPATQLSGRVGERRARWSLTETPSVRTGEVAAGAVSVDSMIQAERARSRKTRMFRLVRFRYSA